MTVEEAYKTLKDPKMAKQQCNFKITGGGGRVSNHDLLLAINKINDRLDQHEQAINNLTIAVNKINDRLDKLENLVVTQFKKHGWIK